MGGTRFGQVVVGPPGSGKTSYCRAARAALAATGRPAAVVNLDPANDMGRRGAGSGLLNGTANEGSQTENQPNDMGGEGNGADICVGELVTVQDVMETQGLGPNGALVYCMDLLAANIGWLLEQLDKRPEKYFIFDFPGQAELYTHHNMVCSMLEILQNKADIRLSTVFLCETHLANEPGKYISAVTLALSSMMHLSTPHVNVLSKVDLLDKYADYEMPLEYYTDVLDLEYLLERQETNTAFERKYSKLSRALADVVSSYSLVSFLPMTVANRATVLAVIGAADKANGYVYGSNEERNIQRLLACAVGAESESSRVGGLRDMYEGGGEGEEEDELLRAYATQNDNVK